MIELRFFQSIIRKGNAKFAIQTTVMRNYIFGCVLDDVVLAKVLNCLFSFLTVFAVLSCEYFLAEANVAACFVKTDTLALVLTRHIATWRLQKRKKSRSD